MKTLALALATISLLVTPAFAQTQATTITKSEAYMTAKPTDVLARNLIGLNVTNLNHDTVGEIEDILISSDGKLTGYIVSVGGFLSLGERYVVVSPSAVRVNYSENDKKWSASMEATKDDVKAAPEFKYEGRWSK